MAGDAGYTPGQDLDGVDLSGARLRRVRLTDARFRMVDLSNAVMRDISLAGASIDGGDIRGLRIDGVDVAPLIEAELLRRQPARALLAAADPVGLSEAWTALQASWAATDERVDTLPESIVHESVEDEWSYAQTLRHLVFVTDAWLGAARGTNTFHPWGIPFTDLPEFVEGGLPALGIDPDAAPTFAEIRMLRADRASSVRDFVATVSKEQLQAPSTGPVWAAGSSLTVLQCLHVLFEEECEHLRFAQRDLDSIEARLGGEGLASGRHVGPSISTPHHAETP